MSSCRFHVVFNALAGSAASLGLTVEALQEKFRSVGLEAEIDAAADQPLNQRIEKALASDAEVIVAAGGDGTITALASAIVDTEKVLALLPLGTANLLARDLQVPLDVDKAIAALAVMQPRRIDVGEMNGRIFLHKAVIGTIPGIAAARESLRGDPSIGARIDFLRYFLRRISNARPIALEIDPMGEGEKRVERVQAIAVANNAYDEGLGRFFSRKRLDRGTLGLYILKRLSLTDMMRLAIEMLAGRWRQDSALAIHNVEGVVLRTRRRRVQVMIDGEVERLPAPFNFRIRPMALSVLAPAVCEDSVQQPEGA